MKKINIHINEFWLTIWMLFSLITIVAFGIRIIVAANFYTDCTTHFYNAKHAATAEIASQELEIAINAMEDRGYTTGPVIGILEPENKLGFCYTNLLNFKAELENFDSANKNTEVYNVELNALQERLGESEPPYLISLGNIYYRWAYLCIVCIYIIISIATIVIVESHINSETFSVLIPSFFFGKTEKKEA